MFKVVSVDRRNHIYGVLDTRDGVIEYHNYDYLRSILDMNIPIDGCILVVNDETYKYLFIYENSDILYNGDRFRLVLDKINDGVYIICPSISSAYVVCKFWITGRHKLRVINDSELIFGTSNSPVSAYRSQWEIDSKLLVGACRSAKEIANGVSSLFINFDSSILEVYLNQSLTSNKLETLIIER